MASGGERKAFNSDVRALVEATYGRRPFDLQLENKVAGCDPPPVDEVFRVFECPLLICWPQTAALPLAAGVCAGEGLAGRAGPRPPRHQACARKVAVWRLAHDRFPFPQGQQHGPPAAADLHLDPAEAALCLPQCPLHVLLCIIAPVQSFFTLPPSILLPAPRAKRKLLAPLPLAMCMIVLPLQNLLYVCRLPSSPQSSPILLLDS